MLNIKTKSILHIYTAPWVDWYQVNRYRASQFGGEAIIKWYPLRDSFLSGIFVEEN